MAIKFFQFTCSLISVGALLAFLAYGLFFIGHGGSVAGSIVPNSTQGTNFNPVAIAMNFCSMPIPRLLLIVAVVTSIIPLFVRAK